MIFRSRRCTAVLIVFIVLTLLFYTFTATHKQTLALDSPGGVVNPRVDTLLKTISQFTIDPLIPFFPNDSKHCNVDTTCYENWLATTWRFPKLNQSFRNPCWNVDSQSIQCFPRIHLVGWAKSGTTDMCWYWNQHSQLISNSRYKETHFLTQFSFGGMNHTKMLPFVHQMERFFGEASNRLLKSDTKDLLMFDCSATTVYDNWHWRIKQGYQGDPNIPTHTNFHYLRKVHPLAKIVVMMRNPMERALSFYNHGVDMSIKNNANLGFSYKILPSSSEDIHTFFSQSIEHFTKCVEKYSLRACCHMSGWESQDWADPQKFMILRVGIYYVFLEEIFKNFSIEQVLLIKSEDFFQNPKSILKSTFHFLNVSSASVPSMLKRKKNQGILMNIPKYFTPLLKTKQLLNNFYKPYNERLAKMLQSNEWLIWNELYY